MPSAKKRAVKKAASEAQGEEEHGEGYMALEEPEGAAASRRQGAASPSQPAPAKGITYEQGSRVMFIGNLPHGFYERQLLGFFSQFGKVTRVRLSRNKKSGKAKHYAFLEFQHPEVAKIAAEALDGYFMFKQKLTCALMAPEKIHPQLFKGANRKFRAVPWRKLERQRHDKERSWDEHVKRVARIVKQDKKRQEKIRAAGMEYDYPALEGLPIQPKRILFASD